MIDNPANEHLRFDVEIPTAKSLYIEICFNDVVIASGTGFLVANDQQSHCTFITNRHNVTGRHQETNELLDQKRASIPNNIVIYFHKNETQLGYWAPIRLPLYRNDDSPYWIEHPRLGSAADMVALNLKWGSDVWKMPYYLKTAHDRVGMVILPAEPVSVIGFPFGLSSVERFPLWATGFLAQELSLITPENPVFLVDCRTRRGQSGSAVIAYRPSGFRKREGNKIVAQLSHSKTWEFLGIYSGRVNSESDLGRVWHVSAIQELLDAAEADYNSRGNQSEQAALGDHEG